MKRNGLVEPGISGLSSPLPLRLAKFVERQHGVVARRQLVAAGMATSTIDGWIRAGHLHLIHRGTYALGHALLGREGKWMAAVLACGEGSVLSHGPSGQLFGFVDQRERFAIHVSLPDRSDRRIPGIVTHRPRLLLPADTTTRLRIPTTTPTRTIYDLAATLPLSPTRRAFEKAERLNLLNRPRLRQLIESSPTHRGNGTLRSLLAARLLPLSETRSWLEDLLLFICAEHSLPLPAISVPLLGYEVDFLWPAARFVIEADGGDHLDPTQRDRDNTRDITLGRAGYLVRRYSSRAMGHEAEVAAEVLAILRDRGPSDRNCDTELDFQS